MVDLSTKYMGITLKNPVIAGASGITSDINMIKKLEEAGAGAIVCKSLFEEQIRLNELRNRKDQRQYDDYNSEMTSVFPELGESGPREHLYWVKKAKESVDIPVFASLNAVTPEIWVDYARQLAETGVDGLELNFFFSPVDQNLSSDAIEDEQIAILKKVKWEVSIPVSVKLSSFYTNPYRFIMKLNQAGIDGYVLFNRLFQSDIDTEAEKIAFPFTFSVSQDNLLPLKYVGLLHGAVKGSLCASTGILDAADAVKMLLAGADAVQVVSSLYRNGVGHIRTMLDGLEAWMGEHEYTSLGDFRGIMSRSALSGTDAWIYKRSQYVKMLMQSGAELAKQIF